ncbi:MAG: phosphodiesterase [Johnsonella sp.]|nr:phosphodiesterase [Johnsonella sp.]
MKYMFASDIHGSAYYANLVAEKFEESKAKKLILLGDLLYHGPRNDLPRDYAPKRVIEILNRYKDFIFAVRGNCDSEVDQMVLNFPLMADYAFFSLNDADIYASHGHVYSPENLLPMQPGSSFIFGHIHLPIAEKRGEYFILNPGSAALPKGGNPPSYAILEGKRFQILTFEGEIIKETDIG